MLNRLWAYSLLKGTKFMKRKMTTAKIKHSVAAFQRQKEEDVLNWDQTGLNNCAIQHMDHGRARFKVSGCCWSK